MKKNTQDSEKISNQLEDIKACLLVILHHVEDIETTLNISKKKPVEKLDLTEINFNKRRARSIRRAAGPKNL